MSHPNVECDWLENGAHRVTPRPVRSAYAIAIGSSSRSPHSTASLSLKSGGSTSPVFSAHKSPRDLNGLIPSAAGASMADDIRGRSAESADDPTENVPF